MGEPTRPAHGGAPVISADVVICGAGIAGIATAHALSVTHGLRNVLLVDERAPLTLTSDKSTEAYRNWWPGPDDAMVQMVNRSIDLLEQWSDDSDDRFGLNRRGYLYATRDAGTAARFAADAMRASAQGAGPVRTYRTVADAEAYVRSPHRGFRGVPDGADLFVDRDAIRRHFPWMHRDIVAVLHARRCGWFSGQQLGMYLLDEAKAVGVQLLSGRVTRVLQASGTVEGVDVARADGTSVHVTTSVFVNAAGPYAAQVGELAGADLPLFSEAHYKIAIEDTAGVVDRDTGLVILDDPQRLDWTDEERDELAADDSTRWLTEPMPAGIHLRPEGYGTSRTLLMLWDYHSAHRFIAPEFPMPDDALYPELVLRGMTALAPGLCTYLERLPHAYMDGGYYTKTAENRPLVGRCGGSGSYVCAGFSGFGLMAAPACGELLAAQIVGSARPAYEKAFLPARYDDPAYVSQLAHWGSTGQL